MWYHQESNRGHKDFQSFALPTELWHHRYLQSIFVAFVLLSQLRCKGSTFILFLQVFQKKKCFYLHPLTSWLFLVFRPTLRLQLKLVTITSNKECTQTFLCYITYLSDILHLINLLVIADRYCKKKFIVFSTI